MRRFRISHWLSSIRAEYAGSDAAPTATTENSRQAHGSIWLPKKLCIWSKFHEDSKNDLQKQENQRDPPIPTTFPPLSPTASDKHTEPSRELKSSIENENFMEIPKITFKDRILCGIRRFRWHSRRYRRQLPTSMRNHLANWKAL